MSELLTCGVCGKDFQARSDAVYCSSACRQKAHRGRTARRIAGLAEQWKPRARIARAFTKPDTASIVRRARHAQHRARELCRNSAALRQALQARQRLPISQWEAE